MRFIETEQLQEGMVLAQPLYGSNFGILLGEGMKLTRNHLFKISDWGYGGVYIEDEISKGITARHVLGEELRMEAVKGAFELLRQAEKGAQSRFKVAKVRQDQLLSPIIDGLIGAHNRVIDVYDTKPGEFYNYYHAANVMILSVLLGLEMGLSGPQLYELGLASMLHDVGNIFLPRSILDKPGKLTEQEYDIIKSHSQMGFNFLLEHYDISIEACMGALQHHENYNGTGYPNRLRGDRISIYGRIVALAATYDAMISRRPFRSPMLPPWAMEYMERNAGIMFDPDVVRALRRIIALYPCGTCVELSNGLRGIVMENNPDDLKRPWVRILEPQADDPQFIDLGRDPEFEKVFIVKGINVIMNIS